MSTAKALATIGTVGGGALGGAALGGAFSGDKTSTVATQEESDKSVKVSSPKPSTNDTVDEQTKSKTPKDIQPNPPKVPEPPITYSFLHEHSPSDSVYNNESVAHKYKHLIVHAFGKTDNSNDKWWTSSYKKYTEDSSSETAKNNLSGDFVTTAVTLAFASSTDNENTKALNKVCDAFYKKKLAETLEGDSDKDKKDKNKINFWKYCSPLGKAPVTVQEKGNSDTLYTAAEAMGKVHKNVLLSVEDGDNDVLWEIKNKRFFALQSVSSAFFKALLTTTPKPTNKNALRDKCKDAYTKKSETGTEATKVSIEDVKKFCTVDLIQ